MTPVRRLLRFFRIDYVASKLRSSGEYQLGYDPTTPDQEVTVRIMTMGIALLAATALALSASAQTTPTAPAITRIIVAATKLPSVVETPLYFKAMRVTLQPGGKSSLSAANGILYQLSGSTEISLGGENKVLSAGEALFVAAGKTASLSAGSGAPSIFCLSLNFSSSIYGDQPQPARRVFHIHQQSKASGA